MSVGDEVRLLNHFECANFEKQPPHPEILKVSRLQMGTVGWAVTTCPCFQEILYRGKGYFRHTSGFLQSQISARL